MDTRDPKDQIPPRESEDHRTVVTMGDGKEVEMWHSSAIALKSYELARANPRTKPSMLRFLRNRAYDAMVREKRHIMLKSAGVIK